MIKVRAILEALWCFSRSFHESFIVKSDSSDAVSWVSNRKVNPYKFQFLFNEIHALSSSINVAFRFESKSANSNADALAKQGVERSTPWEGIVV